MARNLESAILIGLLVLTLANSLVWLSEANQNELGEDLQVEPQSARERFILPKQFNFEHFEREFNKHYATTAERIVRAKLYLGRAFRAFISVVSYKHGKSSSYLAINHMSDWTPEELKTTLIDPKVFSEGRSRESITIEAALDGDSMEQDDIATDDTPVGDLHTIERTLKEIIAQKDTEPAFQDVAEELKNLQSIEPMETQSGDDSIESVDNQGVEEIVKLKEATKIIPNDEAESINSKKSDSFLRKLVRGLKVSSRKKPKVRPPPDEIHIDYRDCLLPARSQMYCGSCYSFSTIALYEWAYCKATGEKVSFSEQYPLDCGKEKGLNGCNSGLPEGVRSFSRKYGLQLRSEYPYVGKNQQCLYDSSKPLTQRSYVQIYDQGKEYLYITDIEKKLQVSPIVMAIYVESGYFHQYSGGVDTGGECQGKNKGGHGMLLVGSGREDGEEYWLLRNSFGRGWGEQGHYKLSKKSGCIIDNHGLILKFAEVPVIKFLKEDYSVYIN